MIARAHTGRRRGVFCPDAGGIAGQQRFLGVFAVPPTAECVSCSKEAGRASSFGPLRRKFLPEPRGVPRGAGCLLQEPLSCPAIDSRESAVGIMLGISQLARSLRVACASEECSCVRGRALAAACHRLRGPRSAAYAISAGYRGAARSACTLVVPVDREGGGAGGRFRRESLRFSLGSCLASALALASTFLFRTAVSAECPAHCETPGSCDKHSNPLWRSREGQPFARKLGDALIFTGTANEQLGAAVADRLSTRLGRVSVGRFADGEVNIQFLDSLRGKDVYLIQPTSTPVNDHLMELLLMISTCRRASAKKITAVIPYFGYARQDRKLNSRVPISAADVARMMESMGVDRVVAVDLHCGQIQGFFGPRVPVDNVEAQIVGLDYFETKQLSSPVVVSPDAGGVYRARKFQEGMVKRGYSDCSIAMLIKRRIRANEVESMDLVGSVDGRDVIIVDDMIDTAGTLVEAARELKSKGAKRVYAFATHGLFSGPAIDRIQKSALEEVVITDTIKARPMVTSCKKIKILSISILLADAIRRIHQKESLNDLFNFSSGFRAVEVAALNPENATSTEHPEQKDN
ncbi:hypothetical protein Efla_006786 [Eimeria flavescens]